MLRNCLSCKVEEKSYPINTETLIRHHFSFSLALSYQRKAGKEGGLFNTEWNRGCGIHVAQRPCAVHRKIEYAILNIEVL